MKKLITSYTFDASAKTVTLTGLTSTLLEQVLLITNVTDNIIIYNFADATKGGSIASGVITLAYDTTSMADTDDLQIFIDDLSTTTAVTQSGTWDEVGINDSGNSITVDGTVTAELSAVDNAVLDNIDTDLTTIIGHVDGIEGSVDGIETILGTMDTDTGNIATSTASIDTKTPALGQALAAASVPVVLPAAQITTLTPPAAITGFATSAKQDTIIGHVDGLEALATTIDADTSNISTKIDTVKTNTDYGAVVGGGGEATALRVTLANDSTGVVSIDDNGGAITVDGTVAVTHAALTELAAAINSDKVDVNIVSGGGTGGTASTDDSAFTAGSGSGTPIMGFVTSDAVDSGDVGAVKMDVNRNLSVTLGTNLDEVNDAITTFANTAKDGSGTAYVPLVDTDGHFQVDVLSGGGGGTQYTEGDTDATATGTVAMMEVGSDTLQPIQGTVAGGLLVNLGGNNDVTVTGTVDLGATDNAVLDQLELNQDSQTALLTTIDGDTSAMVTDLAAIETLLTTIEGNQLPDSHNVTVDNTVTVDLGANNDVTVTGTVDLGATDNAVLDQLELNQDAQTAILTTIDADTGAIKTALETAGGLVVNLGANNDVTVTGSVTADLGANNDVTITSGTITAVTAITNALPAGTNAIGKLAANSGVDIGDVDVTSIPALVAGTAEIGSLLPPDTDVTAHTNYARKYYTSTGAATDGIIWSPAAGKRWHVVTMYIQTSAAATITLEDDKSGGDDPVWKGEIAANSGVTLSFTEQYPMASGEDAADLTITTTAGNVYVTVVGYEI